MAMHRGTLYLLSAVCVNVGGVRVYAKNKSFVPADWVKIG